MAEPQDRSFGMVRARLPRLVPHQTRVVVQGKAAGMVLAVKRGYRRPLLGTRVSVPASVIVLLDSGRRVEVLAAAVEIEVVSERKVIEGRPAEAVSASFRSLTTDPGDECDQECCA